MLELLLLAIALSMDAFAVAIGLGAKPHRHIGKVALLAGLYFGMFQGMMPLIGYLAGHSVLDKIFWLAPIISCLILCGLGTKMLYEGVRHDDEADDKVVIISHKNMTTLAIATSIDAVVAGFTLNLIDINAYVACAVIVLVTGVLSGFGVFLGQKSGTVLESKAEIFGGLVLIGIGIKMLF